MRRLVRLYECTSYEDVLHAARAGKGGTLKRRGTPLEASRTYIYQYYTALLLVIFVPLTCVVLSTRDGYYDTIRYAS